MSRNYKNLYSHKIAAEESRRVDLYAITSMEIRAGSTKKSVFVIFSPLFNFNFPFSREGEPRKFVAYDVSAGRNENATAKLPISSPRIFLAPFSSPFHDEKRSKGFRSILSFLPANSPELATTSGTEISRYTCTTVL